MSSTVLRLLVLGLVSAASDPEERKVKPEQDVTLQCDAQTHDAVTLLECNRHDLKSAGYVFFYRNERSYENYQHERYRGRAALRDPDMKDGDVSVVLKNVSVDDTGTYECRVTISKTGRNETTYSEIKCLTHLKVTDSGDTAGSEDERNSAVGLIIVVVVVIVGLFLVVIAIVAILIYRKRDHLYKPADVNAGEPVT